MTSMEQIMKNWIYMLAVVFGLALMTGTCSAGDLQKIFPGFDRPIIKDIEVDLRQRLMQENIAGQYTDAVTLQGMVTRVDHSLAAAAGIHGTEKNVIPAFACTISYDGIDLYFDKGEGKRYRSLGCQTCTSSVCSSSSSVTAIIEELQSGKFSNIAERSGREQDKEDGGGLESLRKGGYM